MKKFQGQDQHENLELKKFEVRKLIKNIQDQGQFDFEISKKCRYFKFSKNPKYFSEEG